MENSYGGKTGNNAGPDPSVPNNKNNGNDTSIKQSQSSDEVDGSSYLTYSLNRLLKIYPCSLGGLVNGFYSALKANILFNTMARTLKDSLIVPVLIPSLPRYKAHRHIDEELVEKIEYLVDEYVDHIEKHASEHVSLRRRSEYGNSPMPHSSMVFPSPNLTSDESPNMDDDVQILGAFDESMEDEENQTNQFEKVYLALKFLQV
jgi:hypothetical protein